LLQEGSRPVSWKCEDGRFTVLAHAETTVEVGAGATADWAVEATFTAPAGTRCVLTGVVAR
jgi:hypothetical protein